MIRRHSFRTRSAVAATMAALTVGCHTYTPVDVAELTPNGETRVKLTDRGSADVAASVGPYAVTLDGRVSGRDDSVVVVAVTQVTRRAGVEERWNGEVVRVPRAGVASFEIQRLSRSRTGFFIGGIVALGTVVGVGLGGGGGVSGRTGNSGPGGSQ